MNRDIRQQRTKPCFLFLSIALCVAAFFLSCGLDEFYYLPQVPESIIQREMNTEATITIPRIDTNQFYYAKNYSIYYRIYISGTDTDLSDNISIINSSLVSDYNAIFPTTDPTNTSAASTSIGSLFSSRNYFKLEFEGADIDKVLTTDGGNLRISFPTRTGDIPVAFFNNGPADGYRLSRSSDLISPRTNDMFFRNTSDLNDNTFANSNENADVAAGASGVTLRFTYVSMYIVAVGIDTIGFTPLYSRPTHVSIFKLPNAN